MSRRHAMVMNIGKEWMEDLPANLGPTFAHELFHAWNSGAIHPADIADIDLARENYTRFLWFVEGVTNYYVELSVVPATRAIGVQPAVVLRDE